MSETELHRRIKHAIIERLELDVDPDSFGADSALFAPLAAGGLDLDSLAAIEIVVGLSKEFGLQLDEVPKEAFHSVRTLARFIQPQLAMEAAA